MAFLRAKRTNGELGMPDPKAAEVPREQWKSQHELQDKNWPHHRNSSRIGQKCKVTPVRFGHGSLMEQFERFWFAVSTVPLGKRFLCLEKQFEGNSMVPVPVRFLKTVLTVPVQISVPGKMAL